jgi:predicted nucleotidyltransferase
MKELIIVICFYLAKLPIIRQSFKLVYWYQAKLATFLLRRNKDIRAVYIKGGYARGDYELIVSDIDLVIVSDVYIKTQMIKSLCFLVRDIDQYTLEEFNLRLKFGSLKYTDTHSWKVIKGDKLSNKYVYNPYKVEKDIIDEVYFYYEWIFENLKVEKINVYRRACLIRNTLRSKRLISEIIHDGSAKASLNEIKIESCKTKNDFVGAFVNMLSFVPFEGEDEEIDQYTKDNFSLGNLDNCDLSKIYLNQHLYNLFRFSGSLNTYDMYQEALSVNSKILKNLYIIRYVLKIIDGKTNHIHKDLTDIQLIERLDTAKKTMNLLDTFNFNLEHKDKIVYITASWGNDYLNRLYETHQKNLKTLGNQVCYLHVSLGGDKEFLKKITTLSTIRIEEEDDFKGLWHKESLFNLAIEFLKGAKAYVFSDIDAVINDFVWLEKLEAKIDSGVEAIQPFETFIDEKTKEITYSSIAALDKKEETFYAPGLMWAFSQAAINKLGKLCDSFHDGSNDGIIFKEITKTHIGMVEKYDWINKKIESYITDKTYTFDYIDYQLVHVSHPEPKHYINMIVFFNLVLPLFDDAIELSEIGLWKWRDNVEPALKTMFSQFRKDRGYASYNFYSSISAKVKEILASKIQEATLYLNDDKKVLTTSRPGSISMFVGQDLKGMIFYSEALEGTVDTSFIHHLDAFEKGKTYSLSFIIECNQDLEKALLLHLRQSHLDNVNFKAKKLTDNLWYTAINFYAWDSFPEPFLDFELKGLAKAALKFNHYAIEGAPHDRPWEWFAEKKGSVKSKEKTHHLTIEAQFAPNWYKVVIKLDGEMEKYKISVKDTHGTNVLLPRFQEPANDYMTFYFKSIVTVESITFELDFDQAYLYSHDIVIFH